MRRLSPIEARRLWYSLPGDVDTRVVAFANAIADQMLVTGLAHRIHLQELELPTLWYGALRRAGYEFVDEVVGLSYADLKTLKHVGHRGAMVILDAVQAATRAAA